MWRNLNTNLNGSAVWTACFEGVLFLEKNYLWIYEFCLMNLVPVT